MKAEKTAERSRKQSTENATSSPSSLPVVRTDRKCTLAKSRLRVAFRSAAEKLVNERSTPGNTLPTLSSTTSCSRVIGDDRSKR